MTPKQLADEQKAVLKALFWISPKQRAEYQARVRAMTPKQLAQQRTRLEAFYCEFVEDLINWATLLLWADGIGTTHEEPAAVRLLVPDPEQRKVFTVSSPSRRLLDSRENPAAAEFLSRYHEMLIGCDLRGWRGARDILCDFADRLTTEGTPLPVRLQQYLIWVARSTRKAPGRKRGRDPYENVDRDYSIANTVRLVCVLSDLRPTRSTKTDTDDDLRPTRSTKTMECGCSIVAEALAKLGIDNVKEEAVAAIWRASNKGNLFALVERPLKRRILGKMRGT
jgi:hypothetical protein